MTNPSSPVLLEHRENVALIRINNPPVNALSQSVRQGLFEGIESAEANTSVEAVLIICEGRTFVAGADVREFGQPPREPHLPDLLSKIDRCSKPVIAALHGTSLGGGFELAMSCHYRIASENTKVGLPEVNLGLIPGAGGTQLLPRLAGIEKSLSMATSGKPEKIGSFSGTKVIDKIVEGDLLDEALIFTKTILEENAGPRPTSEMQVENSGTTETLFDTWSEKLAKKARGQIAPQYIVQSIKNTLSMSFEAGRAEERKMFLECRESCQSHAMRHAFFAEREVAKIPGLDKTTKISEISKVAVIGAGTMGAGIAMCFASKGFPVRLFEINPDNLARGLAAIETNYKETRSRGIIDDKQMNKALDLIEGTGSYQALADVDLVVEAAFENIDVKREIFSNLDSVCKPETIFASNTSYLDINTIAESTSRPERVLGMHFFSPANVMKLLEVVRAGKTSECTLASAMAVGKKIGKVSVAVGHCYGFVGNRMYARYGREANQLLLEGASPDQVDSAMRVWGMAMGPLEVNDMSGIDIAYKARKENKTRFSDDPLYFRAADLMVEAGRLGRKTEAGFYSYKNGKKEPDTLVQDIISDDAKKLGIDQRSDISAEEIQQRIIGALIKEGEKILEEGIASRAGDIDVIWLNGYGFPRFRGGPMYYGKQVKT